jgi:creatinine amidohydrolase
MVLAIEPDAVQMERAAAEYPQFPPVYGATPVPLRQVSASGVFGDPRGATAGKGERILDALTERSWDVMAPFIAGLADG